VVNRKKKAMTKIANGIRNLGLGLGSAVVDSRHEIMEVVNVNNRQVVRVVATSSVGVALHIWKNEGTR
jgi:hypothetical protein